MAPEELSVNQAVDRLVTAFDARGWREDGETALAIARAAAGARNIEASSLVSAVKSKFLLVNAIERSDVEAVVAAALSGAVVVFPAAAAPPRGDTHITVSNTGTLIGTFGDGIVSGVQVHQQQVMGDDAIGALVGEFRGQPEVRDVIDSSLPSAAKRSRLAAIVNAGRDFASDTIAKIVTGLMAQS